MTTTRREQDLIISTALAQWGRRGARVRAERLSPERRSEIARIGGLAKAQKRREREALKSAQGVAEDSA